MVDYRQFASGQRAPGNWGPAPGNGGPLVNVRWSPISARHTNTACIARGCVW